MMSCFSSFVIWNQIINDDTPLVWESTAAAEVCSDNVANPASSSLSVCVWFWPCSALVLPPIYVHIILVTTGQRKSPVVFRRWVNQSGCRGVQTISSWKFYQTVRPMIKKIYRLNGTKSHWGLNPLPPRMTQLKYWTFWVKFCSIW